MKHIEHEKTIKDMDERDWIIARLLYALYAEGKNADYPDAIKSTNWFTFRHSHSVLLQAHGEITKELRTYNPYWKDGWSQ